jgi:hypothetical protein
MFAVFSKPFACLMIATLLCAGITPLAVVAATTDVASSTPAGNAASDSGADIAADVTSPFPDVPANHWAYEAIAQLEKDGYIKGYPNGTFGGNRPMTRYEVASLVNQAVQGIANQAASMQSAEQRDIDALKSLVAEFGNDIKDLQARVSRLETTTNKLTSQTAELATQTAAIKTEADATAQRLAAGKLGIRFYDRPGSIYSNVQMFAPVGVLASATSAATPGTVGQIPNGYGTAVGSNYGTAFPWGPGNNNRTVIGPIDHGTNLLYGSLLYSGSFGQGFSYGARMSARIATENASGLTTTSPSFCTTTGTTNASPSSCSYGDLSVSSSNIPVALDYLFLGWKSRGGIYGQVGRYSLSTYQYDLIPMRWAGSPVTGAITGINDPQGAYSFWLSYMPPLVSGTTLANAQAAGVAVSQPVCTTGVVGLNLGAPISTGINSTCNLGQTELASSAEYFNRHSRTAIGYEFDGNWNQNLIYWDPAAVACSGGVVPAGTTTIATSSPVCAANGGHVPGGAALGNGTSGAMVSALGPNAAYWFHLSQYWGCCHTLGQFGASVAYGQHLGNDPFTGTKWIGSGMAGAAITYASKGNLYGNSPNPLVPGSGTANSNVVSMYWEYAGLGAGTEGYSFTGSVIPENNTTLSNSAGTQHYVIQLDHWFNDNFRAGITFQHFSSLPGITIPGGSLTCPGCFVNGVNVNQVYLDTYLYLN